VRQYPGQFSDGTHILIRKLVWPITISALRDFIIGVYLVISKEQMFGILARWVIALVENFHAVRDRAFVKNPTDSMSRNAPFASWTNTRVKPTVTGIFSRCPQPALSKFGTVGRNWTVFVHLFPKSFRGCWGKALRSEIVGSNIRRHIKSLVFGCSPRDSINCPGHFSIFPKPTGFVNCF
jgi:hypothetical protein